MMSKFNIVFEQLMNDIIDDEPELKISKEDFNKLENINNSIILESKQSLFNSIINQGLLNCPNTLFNIVKGAVNDLVKNNDYSSQIKISVFEAINDDFCKESDQEIYNILIDLFKEYKDAYFKVKIVQNEGFNFTEECGMFSMPKIFKDIVNGEEYINQSFKYPRIKNLSLNNILIKKFCQDYNNEVKNFKNQFEKRNAYIKKFKEYILNNCDKDFGTIIIYPQNCTLDDQNINQPTLNEAIIHECQHLCIFLLSIAKTCAYIGIHFSNLNVIKNQIINNETKYFLKAEQFITLFSSYSNILIRIFKKINEPKNLNDFVITLLQLSLYNADINNKYSIELKSSRMFNSIKNFYLKIWRDSYYKKYDKVFKNGKFQKITGSEFIQKNKFNKLLKWTYKKLDEELK